MRFSIAASMLGMALLAVSLQATAAVDLALTPLKGTASDGQATAAAFAAFLTTDNYQTYQTTAKNGDNAVIWARVNADPKHAGMTADLFVLIKIEGTYYMRTTTGAFQVWQGGLATLVPAVRGTTLGSSNGADVFSGKLPLSGSIQIFLGYRVNGSSAVIYTASPQQFDIAATSSPPLNPQTPASTLPKSSYASATKAITPAWKLVSVNGSYFNTDIVTGFNSNSISEDGNRIVFSSWSSHGFGLGTKSCSFDWIYLKDMAKGTLSIAAYDLTGKILCGYGSIPGISGNGKYLFYRGSQKPYSWSTTSMQGFWRTELGTSGYMPVNIKGLEFSFEQNGSLRYGTVLKGDAQRYMPDRDGNSVVYSMKYLENVSEVPRQYNATLFNHAILRQDKGSRTVGNQTYSLAHGMSVGSGPELYFDVSSNGAVIVYNQVEGSVNSFRAWDMLSEQDLGRLFNDEVVKQPAVSPSLCGISNDGRYVLVNHTYSVPLDPLRHTTAYTKFLSYGRLSRYDRLKKEFTFVAISEEETRSMDASCDYFTNDVNPRQLSNDGNRVFWDTGGYFFIRDIAAEKTVKIKQPSTIYQWGISGDGRYIVFQTDKAPDGTVYKNQSGGTSQQIYRFGPIEAADFGNSFSLRTFEDKLLAK